MSDPEMGFQFFGPTPTKLPQGAAAGGELQAPPGFKIVKVRKPDGTTFKVKRPVEATQASSANGTAHTNIKAAVKRPAETTSLVVKKGEAKSFSDEAASVTTAATVMKTTTTSKSTSKILPRQKSTVAAPQAAPKPIPEQPRQRSSKPFFNASAICAVTSMIPGVGDTDELLNGDEILDDSNDSDGFDDDDDHEGHDDSNNNRYGDPNDRHRQMGNGMASTTGLVAGLSAQQQVPRPYTRTQDGAAQNQNKSGAQVSERAHPQVNEKDVGNDIKPGDPETQRLHKSFSNWTRYAIWFIMISFPILYIDLGILTAILPAKDYGGSYGTGLAQATKLSVSAWPIIFAAIAAQSLRAIAAYKVERGVRLMILEQLMGSNSVASSIKQPFLLRRFDFVTIALLVLWSLSPLATQALQRMSFDTQHVTTSSATLWYLDTWKYNVGFDNQFSYATQNSVGYGDIIKQFFGASTIPPAQDQVAYQDPWGRPKIPIIKLLDNSTADSEGWIDASTAIKMADFSSNYGIPLQEPKVNDSSYNFTLSSSYLDFDCSPLTKLHPAEFNKTDNLTATIDSSSYETNTTYLKIIPQNETDSGRVIFASYQFAEASIDNYNPEIQGVYAYSACTFTQTFVDSQISCYASQPSTSNTSSPDYTPSNNVCLATALRMSNPQPLNTPMGDFTGAFMEVAGSVLDSYIYNPTNVSGLFNNNISTSILNVSVEDFTQRLSLLVNTYWQLGFGPTVQDSGLNHETAMNMYNYTVRNVTADVSASTTVYAVSWPWIAVLFLCSGILLAAGLASMFMDSRTIVPDMLGFASSLARKSRYVDLPKVNSSMGGAERARLLGDHRVMMQDVRPAAAVGRVALGSAHANAKRLERGRDYR